LQSSKPWHKDELLNLFDLPQQFELYESFTHGYIVKYRLPDL